MDRKKILIQIIILTVIIILFVIFINPSTKYNKISINEKKWNNIINERTENTNIILEDIEFNGFNLIIDESNSTLYYSIVEENKTKYNPKVIYKTEEKNAKIAILSDTITGEKIQNNHEFSLIIYNNSEYHIYKLICTNYPLLNIKYKEDNQNKHKNIPVDIYIFNNLSNNYNRVTKSAGRLKISNNNENEEKEYIFSLVTFSPGKNQRDNKISLFNMKPRSKYKLTIINNNSEESEVEINKENESSNKVELFINNKYEGLYLLSSIMDRLEKIGEK